MNGAMEGVATALAIVTGGKVTCCIDSQSVIWGLTGKPLKSSQKAFLQWQEERDVAYRGGEVTVDIKWSPGHMGIRGNDEGMGYVAAT